MLKKTIKYVDYNDEERVEDFYFNLTKAELTEMNFSEEGGLQNVLRQIMNTRSYTKIAELFKTIILKSYGEKSPDGKRFIKTDDNGRPLAKNFEETQAYSELYMELASNDEAATAFIIGIIPKDIRESVQKEVASNRTVPSLEDKASE